MNDVLDSLLAYLGENWPELLWIVVAAGAASYFAGRRARSRWQRSEFLDRLNVSLTTLDEGVLRIRTILEMDGREIFTNSSAARTIVEMARRTTESDPILPIPREDCWQYLNAVLNEVSERFAEGSLKRDLGLPFVRGEYLMCLTCEKAGPVRTQKVRAMLVRKSLLTNLPQDEPRFESPNHATRWRTLHRLAKEYEQAPHRFIELEICL